MKNVLFVVSLFWINLSFSQCKTCLSLEDALKAPEKVIILDLSAQKLTEIPKGLNQFVNLERLYLSDNFLNEIDFSTLKLPKLVEINLSNNPGFNALAFEDIAKAVPNLSQLNLSQNAIMDISPEISALEHLEFLDLSENSIVEIPQSVEEMLSLRYLNLSHNKLDDNPMLFSQLWNVKKLELEGNEELKLYQIGSALGFKELDYLSISTSTLKGALPKSFKELDVHTLCITGSEIESFNGVVASNPHIRKIVFHNCDLTDQQKVISWLSRFDSLEVVEFNDMTITAGIDEISNIKEVRFDHCDIRQPKELQEIEKVRVVTSNCGLEKVIEDEGVLATLQDSLAGVSEAMLENDVTPIVEQTAEIVNIPGNKSSEIVMDNSSYSVPSDAFMTEDGKVYKGDVRVEIKEYMDPVTNALEGMPMAYEGEDESGIFSSSGMIDFRAYDENGNELMPNPENPIQVTINDIQPSEQSDLYVYNDSIDNWEVLDAPLSTDYDVRKQRAMDSLNKIADRDLVYTRRVPIIMQMKYKKKKYDPTMIDFTYTNASTRRMTNVSRAKHYLKNTDEKYLSKMTWKIDTVLSPELFSTLKSIKRDQKKANRRHTGFFLFKRYDYDTRPRLITSLAVEPDLERDNYRMTFWYKAEKIDIPVYPVINGNTQRVQHKERSNFRTYNRKLKTTTKELKKIKREEDRYMSKEAEKVRERQANIAAGDPIIGSPRREKLIFALTLFGLINCDFIPRRPAPQYYRLEPKGVDQENQIVHVPGEIRNISLGDNSYSTTDNRLVPAQTAQSVKSFFRINADQIGVITGWKRSRDGLVQGQIYRFSIVGKSEEEVKSIILNL